MNRMLQTLLWDQPLSVFMKIYTTVTASWLQILFICHFLQTFYQRNSLLVMTVYFCLCLQAWPWQQLPDDGSAAEFR